MQVVNTLSVCGRETGGFVKWQEWDHVLLEYVWGCFAVVLSDACSWIEYRCNACVFARHLSSLDDCMYVSM